MLPPTEVRHAISDAVHHGVVERLRQIPGNPYDPRRNCVLYAFVGSHVISRELDRPYQVRAGQLRLIVDSKEINPGGALPHAWLACEHDGDETELVDLTARYYPAWVADAGQIPPPNLPTPYVWALQKDLPSCVVLAPDPRANEAVAAFQAACGAIVDEAASIAVAQLAARP